MDIENTYKLFKALTDSANVESESNPQVDEAPKSQRQLAVELGFSLGKLNYCLRALINKGLVKAENFYSSRHSRAPSRHYILILSLIKRSGKGFEGFLRICKDLSADKL